MGWRAGGVVVPALRCAGREACRQALGRTPSGQCHGRGRLPPAGPAGAAKVMTIPVDLDIDLDRQGLIRGSTSDVARCSVGWGRAWCEAWPPASQERPLARDNLWWSAPLRRRRSCRGARRPCSARTACCATATTRAPTAPSSPRSRRTARSSSSSSRRWSGCAPRARRWRAAPATRGSSPRSSR